MAVNTGTAKEIRIRCLPSPLAQPSAQPRRAWVLVQQRVGLVLALRLDCRMPQGVSPT
jgi:hypothetical protein